MIYYIIVLIKFFLSCICGEHCDNKINKSLAVDEKSLNELEYYENIEKNNKCYSTPSLFSWINCRSKSLINDPNASSLVINESETSDENLDCLNDECLSNALKKADLVNFLKIYLFSVLTYFNANKPKLYFAF